MLQSVALSFVLTIFLSCCKAVMGKLRPGDQMWPSKSPQRDSEPQSTKVNSIHFFTAKRNVMLKRCNVGRFMQFKGNNNVFHNFICLILLTRPLS